VEISSIWVSVEVDLKPITVPKATRMEVDPAPFAVRKVLFAGEMHETAVYSRDILGAGVTIIGPAIVEQLDATTVVWPNQEIRVDYYGQLVLGPL
jgi:N-methylhydantoinase A